MQPLSKWDLWLFNCGMESSCFPWSSPLVCLSSAAHSRYANYASLTSRTLSLLTGFSVPQTFVGWHHSATPSSLLQPPPQACLASSKCLSPTVASNNTTLPGWLFRSLFPGSSCIFNACSFPPLTLPNQSSTNPWGPSRPHSLSSSLHLQLLPYNLGMIIYPGVRPGHKFNCFSGRIWNLGAPLRSGWNTLLSDTIRTWIGHPCLPLIRLRGLIKFLFFVSKWLALLLVLSSSWNKMHVN